MSIRNRMTCVRKQILNHMVNEWLPFWESRGCDKEFGGFLTSYDRQGNPTGDGMKYIVSQARMIWGHSALYDYFPERKELLETAKQGVDFVIKHFWDSEFGGWIWTTDRKGNPINRCKVVYGASFMIYALSQYGLSSGDNRGQEYAIRTFDLLQKYAADAANGGYYENLEADWSISEDGYAAGDRKSLDIHMHLMEAFTTLYKLTCQEIHHRRLNEVINVILNYMVNMKSGCGWNQFDLAFHPIPAIAIRHTWNDDRGGSRQFLDSQQTTSYGHNMELSWLLNRAAQVLGDVPDRFHKITRLLCEHTLKYGIDYENGGIYRDGLHEGPAVVLDKEWWQNCEVLVGFLDAFQITGNERCWEAFENCWEFANDRMINHAVGEWMQLLSRTGDVIIGDMGNPWEVIYHTGRTLLECLGRLDTLLSAI